MNRREIKKGPRPGEEPLREYLLFHRSRQVVRDEILNGSPKTRVTCSDFPDPADQLFEIFFRQLPLGVFQSLRVDCVPSRDEAAEETRCPAAERSGFSVFSRNPRLMAASSPKRAVPADSLITASGSISPAAIPSRTSDFSVSGSSPKIRASVLSVIQRFPSRRITSSGISAIG